MTCKLELWQHGSMTGNRAQFTNSEDGNPMSTQMANVNDEDSSARVTGDCAWVVMEHPKGNGGGGFVVDPGEYVGNLHSENHHGEGKGSKNHRWYKRGDRVNRVVKLVPPTDGYYDDINIYFKRADSLGQWAHFPWVTDALLADPNTSTQKITSDTDTGQPCPGAAKASIIGHRKYRCTYNTEAQIKNLKSGIQGKTGGDPRLAMYNNIIDKFCADSNNIFKKPSDKTCLELTAGRALAIEYCKKGTNIKGANKGDPNCSADLTSLGDSYGTVAAIYCNTPTGRADLWCSCHNVTNGVCDANPTAAGCAKKKETFDKLVDATPSDQKDLWSGMESCFGKVCVGDVFIPANANQNCDKSVNVCIQDITIGSLADSNMSAACTINAGGDGPSVSTPPTSSQESAQSELEEAKAAVARGDAGAQERLDAAEASLDAADDAAGETGPGAYIPKSLDGLKNDRKQQIGAGVMGALVLGCMMMLLLIVAAASGGGSVKKRFR